MATYPTMKTILARSFLALLALSFATRLQAATQPGAASEPLLLSTGEITLDSVTAPNRVNGDAVINGTSRIMVSMRLGRPNATLPDGTWLYQGYRAHLTRRNASNPDADANREIIGSGTLIVRFVSQKVVSLSVADDVTIAALQQKARDTGNRQIAASGGAR